MSVTRGQCDARSTVTFPATRHHRPLAGTKLYCLVTEARVLTTCPGLGFEPRPVDRKSSIVIPRPPSHTFIVDIIIICILICKGSCLVSGWQERL